MMQMCDEETRETRQLLEELRSEHRDLDMVIDQLIASPASDDLLMRRLKKRKLMLKDRIGQLEAMLVPDIPA